MTIKTKRCSICGAMAGNSQLNHLIGFSCGIGLGSPKDDFVKRLNKIYVDDNMGGSTKLSYDNEAMEEIRKLISQQVLEALAEVKSKKKVCDTFHSFGITKRIDAVPLSAIEEVERKYQ